jgi:hypothetical protein
VPAKVELISVSPTRIAWGGTVRIVGKLDGGYLAPDGALVRLRLVVASTRPAPRASVIASSRLPGGRGPVNVVQRAGIEVPVACEHWA